MGGARSTAARRSRSTVGSDDGRRPQRGRHRRPGPRAPGGHRLLDRDRQRRLRLGVGQLAPGRAGSRRFGPPGPRPGSEPTSSAARRLVERGEFDGPARRQGDGLLGSLRGHHEQRRVRMPSGRRSRAIRSWPTRPGGRRRGRPRWAPGDAASTATMAAKATSWPPPQSRSPDGGTSRRAGERRHERPQHVGLRAEGAGGGVGVEAAQMLLQGVDDGLERCAPGQFVAAPHEHRRRRGDACRPGVDQVRLAHAGLAHDRHADRRGRPRPRGGRRRGRRSPPAGPADRPPVVSVGGRRPGEPAAVDGRTGDRVPEKNGAMHGFGLGRRVHAQFFSQAGAHLGVGGESGCGTAAAGECRHQRAEGRLVEAVDVECALRQKRGTHEVARRPGRRRRRCAAPPPPRGPTPPDRRRPTARRRPRGAAARGPG